MDKEVKFRRNVYIILLCILVFAIITQVSRSSLILKLSNNKQLVENEQWEEFKYEAQQSLQLTADQSSQPHHCVIVDSSDEESVGLQDNLSQVYRYMKQAYTIQDLMNENLDMMGCEAVSMTISIEDLEDYVSDIETYVNQGGYFFQMRMDNPDQVITQLYRKFGILDYQWIAANSGIELESSLLIGQMGESFGESFFYNDSLIVELDDDVTVYASGMTNIPIMWSNDYGSGKFMVYNGNNLYAKSNRGLIVGAISLMIPNYIYPIFNEKLFYMDDFPAPIRSEIDTSIYKEYGKDLAAFFRDIWWPDMIKASKRYDVKYTAVAIEVYEDNVIPPFEPAIKDYLTNMIAFGREVLKSGGEIGIHGYNHQPLQFNDELAQYYEYKRWENTDDIELATKEVLHFLSQAFPSYTPISYVPPSNILSEEGRQALVNSWPELKVISALYDTDFLGHSYVQEFEVAPDGVIEMPRITSGYFDTEYTRWLEANVVTTHGFISHFLHPDDLLDKERNAGKEWKGLFEDFTSMLNRMESTYPWIRSDTSNHAALNLGFVLSSQMTRETTKNAVSVQLENQQVTQYFILRSDKKIGRLTNCDVKKIDELTYLVTTDDENFSIELK